jgi:hypothetical protein
MPFETGDLFEVTGPGELYLDTRVGGHKVKLHPGDLGIMLADKGGWLSGHDTYLLFAYVLIRGSTGWIMDDCIRKVNVDD